MTFASLIRPLVDARTEGAATRALRLWAEMHSRDITPDAALVSTMITACERTPSLGVEVCAPRYASTMQMCRRSYARFIGLQASPRREIKLHPT